MALKEYCSSLKLDPMYWQTYYLDEKGLLMQFKEKSIEDLPKGAKLGRCSNRLAGIPPAAAMPYSFYADGKGGCGLCDYAYTGCIHCVDNRFSTYNELMKADSRFLGCRNCNYNGCNHCFQEHRRMCKEDRKWRNLMQAEEERMQNELAH